MSDVLDLFFRVLRIRWWLRVIGAAVVGLVLTAGRLLHLMEVVLPW